MKNPNRTQMIIVLLMIGALFLIVLQQAASYWNDDSVQPYEVTGPPIFSSSPEPSIVTEDELLAPYLPEGDLESLLKQTQGDWQYVKDLDPKRYQALDTASRARLETISSTIGGFKEARYTKLNLLDLSQNAAVTTLGAVYLLDSGQQQFVQYSFSYQRPQANGDWELIEINSDLTEDVDGVEDGGFSEEESESTPADSADEALEEQTTENE